MLENKIVSVIVPVYNVEKYLNRCVYSIVKQTYQDLEIILVDDGSKDLSGKIADQWAQKNPKIKVIHKNNEGLSAARNRGIEEAKGDYLLFVDSDDWIHEDMISAMVKKIEKVDIVCCGMMHAFKNQMIPTKWFDKEYVLSSKQALNLLVDNTILTSHIPRNLYRRELFEKIRFPEGKIFEDLRTSHKLIMQADSVYIVPDYYYYYFMRENSITNIVRLENRLEWFEALKERAEDLKIFGDEYQNKLIMQRAVAISLAVVQNAFSKEEKNENKEKLEQIRCFLKKRNTKKAVKENATKSQYYYYRFACLFWLNANRGYGLIKRIICLKKEILRR